MCAFMMRYVLVGFYTTTAAVAAEPIAQLEPVYRLKQGKFITRNDFEFAKVQAEIEGVAFMAVCTNQWFSGMAAVFQVERTNRFELRRRPPRGQENFMHPLFLGLPLEDETEAAKLGGCWEAIAERGAERKDYPVFEFAVEGDQVAGRFDQTTEYRYAYVSGGTFRSNRLELRIDYMNESWFLVGILHNGKMQGSWRRADDAEQGTWQATRTAALLPSGATVPLYEWRRGDERHYGLKSPGTEWTRSTRPICRVWPATAPNPSK